jgi:hypothetical protein
VGKGSHLARVDHDDREARGGQHNAHWGQGLPLGYQGGEPSGLVGHPPRCSTMPRLFSGPEWTDIVSRRPGGTSTYLRTESKFAESLS